MLALKIPFWKWTIQWSCVLKRNNVVVKTLLIQSKNGFILRILTASFMIYFWKRTVPLSFICVMGNGPMNYNSCLEFSYAWLEFCHQPCIGDYSVACFLDCYCDLFAIFCVAECVTSWQHAWCLRWHLGQILGASRMLVALCDKLRGRQTWLRQGCLIMDRCWRC